MNGLRKIRERTVGLVILTIIPELGECAVLQRRGSWDFENNREQPWPGGCRLPILYGAFEEDHLLGTLRRKSAEEFGEAFSFFLTSNSIFYEFVYQVKKDDKPLFTIFAGAFSYEYLKLIRLQPSSGGLMFIRREDLDLVADLSRVPKSTPINFPALLPEELEAVKKGFDAFSPLASYCKPAPSLSNAVIHQPGIISREGDVRA